MTLDYERTERQLAKGGIDSSLAETQGLLCGLLCTTTGDVRKRWLDELFTELEADSPAVKVCGQTLAELYNHTRTSLDDTELGFSPLLPDDNQPLQRRLEGLVDWCQGFLYGIGLSGRKLDKQLSEQGQEAIRDISEITRLDTQATEENEDNEQALFELEEFIRMGILMLHAELRQNQEHRHDLH